MDSRYLKIGLYVALYIFLICFGCSCSFENKTDIELLVNKLCVSKETFLKIKIGASLTEVKKIFGRAERHEFTVSVSYKNGEYALIGCCVDIGQGINQWLLFRNDILINFPAWVPCDMEEVPYEGTTWRRRKSWNIEDMTRVEKVIAAPTRTLDEIRAYFNSVQPNERTKGEPAKIMLPFWLYAKTMGAKIKKDYQTNWELLGRYDGYLAKIGMTIKEVDKLYGKPLRSFSTKDGCLVRIYGDTRHLEIDPQYKFSCIAVIFDTHGRVTKIFSHSFLNDEWLDSVHPRVNISG